MAKHYCFGSGMHGCLYDYGPNFVSDKEDAIESLMQVFDEQLEDGEPERMRANLGTDGYHKFENYNKAGAHYCDVTEHDGECPESEDD